MPLSPPPPYRVSDQQASQSSQSLPRHRSAPRQTSHVHDQHVYQPVLREEGWQGTADVPPDTTDLVDSSLTRSMNQGAAFCDRVAARLNDVLGRLEDHDVDDHVIESALSGLSVRDGNVASGEATRGVTPNHGESYIERSSRAIINFQKTWLYANSRLPPYMLPFRVYIPTWQIICKAAAASMNVYKRPAANEKQQYVAADWRNGTKAMTLKSACNDEKRLIVIAIRGSKWNLVDWAVNFRPAPTEPTGFLDDDGNACHAGFLQVARSMVKPVAAHLRRLIEEDPGRATSSVVFTGHSAGGAVASLLYMHMLATRVESDLTNLVGCFKRVHCVTFGAPPVSLLPLQKPNGKLYSSHVFVAFVNEGDLVVRADKEYVYTLARLLAAPAPAVNTMPPNVDRQKVSRQRLKTNRIQAPARPVVPPIWPVTDATLSNAGSLVLLRNSAANSKAIEAASVSDDQLRGVVFGDPEMHEMALYKRRVDKLATDAVTGRDDW